MSHEWAGHLGQILDKNSKNKRKTGCFCQISQFNAFCHHSIENLYAKEYNRFNKFV